MHALYGVDDGAKNEKVMHDMIAASCKDGVSIICLTPHFHFGYYGDNRAKSDAVFAELKEYCKETHPELSLYIGNELHYSPDCVAWLNDGACRTMNGTDYVLIDFSEDETEKTIVTAMNKLLNAGYKPILAHAEQYKNLGHSIKILESLHEDGVVIQIDAQSLLGGFGLRTQHRAKLLFSNGIADLLNSDAHNLTSRPPQISEAYNYISHKFGKNYADRVCRKNASYILGLTSQEG